MDHLGCPCRSTCRPPSALDLADGAERREQVEAWLVQIALDAGLLGMERILQRLPAPAASQMVIPRQGLALERVHVHDLVRNGFAVTSATPATWMLTSKSAGPRPSSSGCVSEPPRVRI
jgi:hypothetical protein